MPAFQGTIGLPAIYNGSDKIGKVYRCVDLVYQSYIYNPVAALIEKTIEKVDIELTNEITKIGSYSFFGCSLLNNVIIPSSVTSIGSYAFGECVSLKTMTILATTPPSIAFASDIGEYVTTIYVPASSVSAYETADVWKILLTRDPNPVTFIGI